MKKPRPGLVDRALQSLSPEDQAEWNRFIRFNPSYTQLIDFLKERNAEGADRLVSEHLSNWWANNRPRGTEALALVTYAEQFQGQAPRNLLEMSVGITAKMVQILLDRLDIEGATNASKLYSVIELLKELRQASSELLKLSQLEESNALKFEGANKLADHLRKTYKDTSFVESLESALVDHFSHEYPT
jgi:hypothetical protein